MEIRFSQLELDGERHFVAFLRDITLRKRAEGEIAEAKERLEQRVHERTHELSEANRRLLELDRLKSEFLATMSHELRTPLNSILGFTTVLQGGLAGPLNEEQQRQLAFVHGSGQHLLALINDLLDVSRIESGRLKLARRAFRLCRGRRRGDVAAAAARRRRRDSSCTVRLSSSVHAWGDRRRVYQILLNLAGNAVKFTEQGSGDDRGALRRRSARGRGARHRDRHRTGPSERACSSRSTRSTARWPAPTRAPASASISARNSLR
jgi:signal transduction histidine kinase